METCDSKCAGVPCAVEGEHDVHTDEHRVLEWTDANPQPVFKGRRQAPAFRELMKDLGLK